MEVFADIDILTDIQRFADTKVIWRIVIALFGEEIVTAIVHQHVLQLGDVHTSTAASTTATSRNLLYLLTQLSHGAFYLLVSHRDRLPESKVEVGNELQDASFKDIALPVIISDFLTDVQVWVGLLFLKYYRIAGERVVIEV